MKYASEVLRAEHEGVLLSLDILEKMTDAIRQEGTVDAKDAAELIHFIRMFADKCHHGKEEDLMFPAMEKGRIPRGPIGQMLLEHTQGRRYIAEMAASTEGGTLTADRFAEAATGYIQLMRDHIHKENTVLFPAGDRMLPMDVQKQLLDQFEGFEEEVMEKESHEKLHETLHRLEEKYLKGRSI